MFINLPSCIISGATLSVASVAPCPRHVVFTDCGNATIRGRGGVPCHDGMAHPQVSDGDIDGISEYKK
jgi:hypothetical protein